jgi:hypothetical protein
MKTAFAVVAVIVAAACGSSEDDGQSTAPERTTGSFVGAVEGGGTSVAVVAGPGDDLLAYVTDGGSSVDWLDGVLEDPRDTSARLGNDGGAVLDVSFAGTRASGAFARPGEDPRRFTAEAADEPAGLYRASDSFADGDYVGGWIVLPDGTQRGTVRRYETPLAPGEVDPATFTVGDETFVVPGGELRVQRVDPGDELGPPL